MGVRGLGTNFQGILAIRGLLEDWFGTYEGLQIEAEEILDLGHGITFAVCTQKGHPRGSTAQAQFRFAQLSTWVDGLIVRLTGYNDIEEARAGAERLARRGGRRCRRRTWRSSSDQSTPSTAGSRRLCRAHNLRLRIAPGDDRVHGRQLPGTRGHGKVPPGARRGLGGVPRRRRGVRDLGERMLVLTRLEGRGKGSDVRVAAVHAVSSIFETARSRASKAFSITPGITRRRVSPE